MTAGAAARRGGRRRHHGHRRALRLQALAELSRADVVITLLDAAPRVGGKLVTERVDGFVIDAAADVFLERKPHGVDLCRALGIGHLIQHTAERRSALMLREGELVPATVAAFADAGPLVTLRGGMQTLADAGAGRCARRACAPACACRRGGA